MKTSRLFALSVSVFSIWITNRLPAQDRVPQDRVPQDRVPSDRIALVIGNDLYPAEGNFPSLDNCARDAALMKETLSSLGFRVFHAENATRAEMDETLLQFENAIPKGGTAVFYFAGHGIEFNGKNYLMGSNAKLQARSRLGEEAMDAETFAEAMLVAGAKSSFLFLDCCREVPSDIEWLTRGTRKRGLAELNIDGDIIIAYAAKPGQAALDGQGGNSPYAKALAKWLPSGMKHNDLFDQVRLEVHQATGGSQRTWESGSFLEPFFFTPQGAAVAIAPVPLPGEKGSAAASPAPDRSMTKDNPAPAPSPSGNEMKQFQRRMIEIMTDHPLEGNTLPAVRKRMESLLEEFEQVPTDALPEDLSKAFLDYVAEIRSEYDILVKMPDDFPWSDAAAIEAWATRTLGTNPDLVALVARVPQLEISIRQKGNFVDAVMAKYGIFVANPNATGTPAMPVAAAAPGGDDAALNRFRTQITKAIGNNPFGEAGTKISEQMDLFRRLAGDLALVNAEGLPEDLRASFEAFRKPLLTIAQVLSELPDGFDWDDPAVIDRYTAELAGSDPGLAQRLVSIGTLADGFQKAGVELDAVMARYGIVIE